MSFVNRSIVVTGGTSGVGLATATAFAANGASRIALIGRNHARGKGARQKILDLYPESEVFFVPADANNLEEASNAVSAVVESFGGIDILVNSTTCYYVPKLLFDIPVADIAKILMEQALAPMQMSRLVLPFMRERKSGVIINIASDAAKVTTPGESVIGAAMAAIVMFTRTLAIEAKRDGIRANVITPSVICDTPLYEHVTRDPFSAKLFASAAKLAGLGITKPDDMAELILFLASPSAAKLTGQAISLNGGISAA